MVESAIIRPGDSTTGVGYSDYLAGTEEYRNQKSAEQQASYNRALKTSNAIVRDGGSIPAQAALNRMQYNYNKESRNLYQQQSQGLTDINKNEFEQALADKPSYALKIYDPNDYTSKMNDWILKYQDVLGRPENYETAKSLTENKYVIPETEKPVLDLANQQLQSFKTYAGTDGKLTTQAPSLYNSYFSDAYGWVEKPYMTGIYEELDPNTMTVTVMNSNFLGWKREQGHYGPDNHTYTTYIPKLETTTLGKYTLGNNIDPSQLLNKTPDQIKNLLSTQQGTPVNPVFRDSLIMSNSNLFGKQVLNKDLQRATREQYDQIQLNKLNEAKRQQQIDTFKMNYTNQILTKQKNYQDSLPVFPGLNSNKIITNNKQVFPGLNSSRVITNQQSSQPIFTSNQSINKIKNIVS